MLGPALATDRVDPVDETIDVLLRLAFGQLLPRLVVRLVVARLGISAKYVEQLRDLAAAMFP